MALSDFISSGSAIPAGSALTAVTNQTVLPDWYTNAAMQTLANQSAVSTTPYQTYQAPRVAGFTPTQQAGFNMTHGSAGAYQPGLAAATGTTNAAVGAPGALATAQPWLAQAGQSGASGIGTYMNPWNEAVTSRIAELGARNLSENILPALQSKYISAGQLGFGPHTGPTSAGAPSGLMTDTARAVRDVNNDILGQQSAVLQSGFNTAAGLAQQDLGRALGVGQTTGSLAGQQIGQQLAGGAQQAQLAGLAQQYGLAGANAVGAVGAREQALNQQNLDVAYQDFLRQQGYPQQQIDAMLATIKGLAPSVPSATTQEGIVPSGQPASYAPSTASTIAGGLLGLAGLLKG